jgi:hypothetical protein
MPCPVGEDEPASGSPQLHPGFGQLQEGAQLLSTASEARQLVAFARSFLRWNRDWP